MLKVAGSADHQPERGITNMAALAIFGLMIFVWGVAIWASFQELPDNSVLPTQRDYETQRDHEKAA
jgi:hypothetical protein